MSVIINNLYFAIKKAKILQDINFECQKGEIICILGPSGSGKTTLLRNIIGELKPNKGEILVDDKKVPYPQLYADLGYMPQENALYEDISAYDNLLFFSKMYGIKEYKNRIAELFEITELKIHERKLVSEFSGGMKRRLSLAIAFLHSPKFLILDEPTVGIDPVLREKIWQMIHAKKQDSYIIVTTHVMNDVEKCDKMIILKNGKIADKGNMQELKIKYEVSSAEEVFLKASQLSI